MKQKDLIYLMIAVAILLTAGYIVYMNLMPKSSTADSGVQVDIVGKIEAQMDEKGLAQLSDPTKARDFSSPVDYSGLNNQAPFGK